MKEQKKTLPEKQIQFTPSFLANKYEILVTIVMLLVCVGSLYGDFVTGNFSSSLFILFAVGVVIAVNKAYKIEFSMESFSINYMGLKDKIVYYSGITAVESYKKDGSDAQRYKIIVYYTSFSGYKENVKFTNDLDLEAIYVLLQENVQNVKFENKV